MTDSRWDDTESADLIGTRDDRSAMFDHLVAATLRRQAISPAKNRLFDIDVPRDMGRYRNQLLDASTPAELWYALTLLSNTRHDRHLRVQPVTDGLPVPDELSRNQIRNYGALQECEALRVGIELATDFTEDQPFLFLAAKDKSVALPENLSVGARLLAVNDVPFADYATAVEPYHCYSVPAFFWYHLPHHVVRQGSELPHYGESLKLTFETDDEPIGVDLKYGPSAAFSLPKPQRYSAWTLVAEWESCRLYRSRTARVIALDWLGFGPNLCNDVDALMAFCETHDLLSHDIVFDATRCRGGDYGGYLLRVLAKKRFRINLGDLRRSDVVPSIIDEVLNEDAEAVAGGKLNAGQLEAVGWRRDWLLNAVRASLGEGGSTPLVPFKCAHQPMTGDGWLEPAPVHFTGSMVMLTMPFSGSHIDQVAAQISDNRMCVAHIGMPLGGFSKTWVGTEVLTLPTGKPIVGFEWSCGNTVRPNGQVLESNPAVPDVPYPVSRANFRSHHDDMLEQACAILARAS
ncbi:hypothetical protein [Devosia sp. 2618]|uniref:hypothetical protein n=1 Tax=Devosia sp. 2618 TaxID=3156454 RepID=UPI003397C855